MTETFYGHTFIMQTSYKFIKLFYFYPRQNITKINDMIHRMEFLTSNQ